MSALSSLSSTASYVPVGSPTTRVTPFEVTAKAFGPVAATAAAATAAVTDAVSAGVSLSKEGLQRLADLGHQAADEIGQAWDGATGAVTSFDTALKHSAVRAYQAVEHTLASAASGAASAWQQVEHTAEDAVAPVVQGIAHLASAVAEGMDAAGNTLASGVSLVAEVLK